MKGQHDVEGVAGKLTACAGLAVLPQGAAKIDEAEAPAGGSGGRFVRHDLEGSVALASLIEVDRAFEVIRVGGLEATFGSVDFGAILTVVAKGQIEAEADVDEDSADHLEGFRRSGWGSPRE